MSVRCSSTASSAQSRSSEKGKDAVHKARNAEADTQLGWRRCLLVSHDCLCFIQLNDPMDELHMPLPYAHTPSLTITSCRYMGVVDPKAGTVGTVCHGMSYGCGAGSWGHALHEDECTCPIPLGNHLLVACDDLPFADR